MQVERGPREKTPATLPACLPASRLLTMEAAGWIIPRIIEEHDPQRESERGWGGGGWRGRGEHTGPIYPIYAKKKQVNTPSSRPRGGRCRCIVAAAAIIGKLPLPPSEPPPHTPLLSPPPSTPPPLILSYINSPPSGGEPDPGVSSLPADDAIRWFILSSRPDGITATSLSR